MSAQGAAAPMPDDAEPGAPPKHIYDAVTTQREHVLGGFDNERAALLKAVADQREAALAPVRAVQARQAAQAIAGQGNPRLMAGISRQQLVAADIAATIKAMVAEEVHNQIVALLQHAGRQVKGEAPAPDIPSAQ
jgi:hypothetical protein